MASLTLTDLSAAGWAAEGAVDKGRAYVQAHPEPRWQRLLAQREQEAEVALARYWLGRCLCVAHVQDEEADLTSLLAAYLEECPERRHLFPEVGPPALDPAVAAALQVVREVEQVLHRGLREEVAV